MNTVKVRLNYVFHSDTEPKIIFWYCHISCHHQLVGHVLIAPEEEPNGALAANKYGIAAKTANAQIGQNTKCFVLLQYAEVFCYS